MRSIDADALEERLKQEGVYDSSIGSIVSACINHAMTVRPQLKTCSECRWLIPYLNVEGGYCTMSKTSRDPDWYCADGQND